MNSNQTTTTTPNAVNEEQFRTEVIPRAQLSMMASQMAVDKATQANAKEFAGFELMEAIAVIDVLKDVGTPVPPLGEDAQAFLTKLERLSGPNFDKEYMQAELSNHEFLRDLAQQYLNSAASDSTIADKETRHIAAIALYAFKEHVAMSKRILAEMNEK